MKNIFLAIALTILMSAPTLAVNIEVEALSDFSTDNPPQIYSVKVVEPIYLPKGTIESGSIIKGNITTKDAQRLKRDATFSFIPKCVITPQGEVIKAESEYIGKYKTEIDKKEIAKSAALTAGNFVVKGFSTGVTALSGAVKNEQGNRIKSSAVAVYEGSPISYIQKGKALEIKQGQHFYINFKIDDDDNDVNDNVNKSIDIDNVVKDTEKAD